MKKLFLLMFVLMSLQLHAEESADKNVYLGLEGGYVKIQDVDGVEYGRLFSGIKLNQNVAFELGLFRTGDTDYRFSYATVSAYGYGYDASVIVRPDESSGVNGLFFRLGGHYDRYEFSCRGYCNVDTASLSGGGALAGVGYDAKLNDSVSARFSYTYYDRVAGTSSSANSAAIGILFKF
jgi:hypothetical protein